MCYNTLGISYLNAKYIDISVDICRYLFNSFDCINYPLLMPLATAYHYIFGALLPLWLQATERPKHNQKI